MTTQPKSTDTAVKRTARAVEQHSRKVADSAAETREAAVAIETSADLNTRLAADRNVLAAERTYAAWVRTGLFALASALGARALLHDVVPDWLVLADATMLIAFSVFCFGAAIWRELNPGAPPPVPRLRAIPRPVLIGVNGFLALVSIAALIGIWLGPKAAAVAQAVPPA